MSDPYDPLQPPPLPPTEAQPQQPEPAVPSADAPGDGQIDMNLPDVLDANDSAAIPFDPPPVPLAEAASMIVGKSSPGLGHLTDPADADASAVPLGSTPPLGEGVSFLGQSGDVVPMADLPTAEPASGQGASQLGLGDLPPMAEAASQIDDDEVSWGDMPPMAEGVSIISHSRKAGPTADRVDSTSSPLAENEPLELESLPAGSPDVPEESADSTLLMDAFDPPTDETRLAEPEDELVLDPGLPEPPADVDPHLLAESVPPPMPASPQADDPFLDDLDLESSVNASEATLPETPALASPSSSGIDATEVTPAWTLPASPPPASDEDAFSVGRSEAKISEDDAFGMLASEVIDASSSTVQPSGSGSFAPEEDAMSLSTAPPLAQDDHEDVLGVPRTPHPSTGSGSFRSESAFTGSLPKQPQAASDSEDAFPGPMPVNSWKRRATPAP